MNCNVSLYADDTLMYSEIQTIEDKINFQANINSLHDWSMTWKMPFNTSKCEVIVFGKPSVDPHYTLNGIPLRCVEETKYLGVIIQSDLNFDSHIHDKIRKASKTLGSIKHTLHEAPQKAKLLAYISLCRPILDYADCVWDPSSNHHSEAIEKVQNMAIRFIKGLNCRDSISKAREELQLLPLKDRRKNHRLALLMKILLKDEKHGSLSSAYDERRNNKELSTA